MIHWEKIEDSQDKVNETWYIEFQDYTAEVWAKKRTPKCQVRLWFKDEIVKSSKCATLTAAKRIGQRFIVTKVKAEIKELQGFLNSLPSLPSKPIMYR